jgi:malate dehydrogenase (oxaloacetate-decarboxylating)
MDNRERALGFHKVGPGKVGIQSEVEFGNAEDLGMVYTPGMAYASEEIAADKSKVYDYTMKGRAVAIVSDGTAVLGFGDIGPEAGLPVMEGKSLIFKKFVGLDAFPLCVNSNSVDELVRFCEMIEPTFGAIQLEDIKAPECFEVEARLKKSLNIPVLHDDQHGTAVVVMAGIINALTVVGKEIQNCKIIVNGAGAAGTAITKLLIKYGAKDISVLDSRGVMYVGRENMNKYKDELAEITNPNGYMGGLKENLIDADIFIGVSVGNLLDEEDVQNMSEDAIIFALANPIPEINYDIAKKARAKVVATGRADYPNQVNNVLAFPGLFKGILESGKKHFNEDILLAAAKNLAAVVENVSEDMIIPPAFAEGVAEAVAKGVKEFA